MEKFSNFINFKKYNGRSLFRFKILKKMYKLKLKFKVYKKKLKVYKYPILTFLLSHTLKRQIQVD